MWVDVDSIGKENVAHVVSDESSDALTRQVSWHGFQFSVVIAWLNMACSFSLSSG